jgi:hypothetical protein
MINTQRGAVETALRGMLDKLKEDEMAHRKKFRENMLADAFPQTLSYYHETIGEAIGGEKPVEFGMGFLEQIAGYIEKFKEGLRERGSLEAYDTVTYELELLEYPLAELGKFFAQPQESKLNEKDAMIFHFFIRHRISNLIRIAKEIDEEYGKEL